MSEPTNSVSAEFDSLLPLQDALEACRKLGLLDVTVTTVVTPKAETLPARCRYVLDAVKPSASRALASTRQTALREVDPA